MIDTSKSFQKGITMRCITALAAAVAMATLVSACGPNGSPAGGNTPAGRAASPTPNPTANGVAELPADEALRRAVAALTGASSVHVTGNSPAFGYDVREASVALRPSGHPVHGYQAHMFHRSPNGARPAPPSAALVLPAGDEGGCGSWCGPDDPAHLTNL